MKMVRQEALPLSGEAGISDIRDMIATDSFRASGEARAGHGPQTCSTPMSTMSCRSSIPRSQAVQRGPRCRQRHGRPGRPTLRASALPDDALVLRHRRHVSQSRGQPAHRREPPRHRRARCRRKGGHRHRLGRRRGPLFLHHGNGLAAQVNSVALTFPPDNLLLNGSPPQSSAASASSAAEARCGAHCSVRS